MNHRIRMSAEERKLSIINAAKPLFAAKGFNGTSVRHIAKAANVSEALLYKHFPSKEAMHNEILSYTANISTVTIKELKELEPCTETLVLLIYALFQIILFEVPGKGEQQRMHERLLFYSLLEDVSYAQMVFEKIEKNFSDIAYASYEAAATDGDIVDMKINISNRFWFIHNLAMALNLCHLSGESAYAYEMSKEAYAEDAIHFVLRGIGLTDDAIGQYYKPKKMKIYMKGLFSN